MPSKVKPKSVRLGEKREAALAARAAAEGEGITPHSLIIRGVDMVLASQPPAVSLEPKAILAQAEAKAAHLALPKRRTWSLKGVHLGPIEPPMGSLLKGAK